MRGLFSARELRQAAQRAKAKNDGETVHLAVRWAGKEAFLKAWCEALAFVAERDAATPARPYTIDAFPWPDIEILDDSHGVPMSACPRKCGASCGNPWDRRNAMRYTSP